IAGREGIDLEFPADGIAVHVVALCKHAPAAAVLTVTRPGHHEVAGAIHRHGRVHLIAHGRGVDPELTPQRYSSWIVALAVHAPAATVLAIARPGKDRVTRSVHGHGGIHLVADRVGVYLECIAEGGPRLIVALGVDSPAATLARPSNYEVAVSVRGD